MSKTIWHYTSADSAVSILSSGELWAHRASQMVDKTEITYALEQIRRFALDEVPDHLGPRAKTFIAAALEIDDPLAQQRNVFLVSASLNGDSDYLWRKYARAGGVAIEISIDERYLTERTFPKNEPEPMTGWYPVAYTDDHQGRLIESWADALAFGIACGDKYPEHFVWSRYVDLSPQDVSAYFSALVSTLKEPGWLSEEEYRYVDRLGVDGGVEVRGTGEDFREYTRLKPPVGQLQVRSVEFASDCTPEHEAEIRAVLEEKYPSTVTVKRR